MMSPLPLLVFLLFSISTCADDSQPASFTSVLRSHGLPIGLVPTKQIAAFTFSPSTGHFEIHLYQACNAKFENQVHYDFNVTGTIRYGQIAHLSGMSAQELFLWFPVKEIRVDVPSSGLIYFDVGGVVFKQFSLSLFETPPDCLQEDAAAADGENGKDKKNEEEVKFSAELQNRLKKPTFPQQGAPMRASS